ncbi:DUF2029 domain-containing protein [Cellulomonas sp. zg-ZUI222]|uniref:glycosyltransferase 87 family protein n=1 Tax=Cellulomonas wangleii TaxID=2816956 RepID=UPI001A9520FA|nr:glycosyltransferase 87 family protein [Cellulomonas wangleii]MBO0919933.1 DUF2029 domain-containing protein [Cellulomonas wangleii]
MTTAPGSDAPAAAQPPAAGADPAAADPAAPAPSAAPRAPRLVRDALVWLFFVAVHVWGAHLGAGPMAGAYTDVELYRWWVQTGLDSGQWPVLDGAWVYPAGAVLPMLVPAVVSTTSTLAYTLGWCALVTVLDAVAVALLLRRRAGRLAASWWIAFLLLLGPVAMGRLDAVVAPMSVIALLVALTHPRTSAVLVTAAAWIKVSPGAAIIPLLLAARRPWRDVVEPAVLVCAVVVGTVVALGGGDEVLSFVRTQGERGLQVESVAATGWLVAGLWTPTIRREFNPDIISVEVYGPGAQAAADTLGAVLPIAVLLTTALLWWRRRREGQRLWSDDAVRADLVVRGTFALTLVLIVANKVGSPQFISWLAPPVAVALALGLPRWRPTAVAVAVVAGATQWVYPWYYPLVMGGQPLSTMVLVGRNVALVVLLVVTLAHLARVPRAPSVAGAGPATEVAPDPSGAVGGEPGEQVRA